MSFTKGYSKAKAFTELLPPKRRFVYIDGVVIITPYLLQHIGEELPVLPCPRVSEPVSKPQQEHTYTKRLPGCLPSTQRASLPY